MKFAALAIAAFASTAYAEVCPIATLASDKNIKDIIPAASACSQSSGYNFMPPSKMPTPEQIKKVCECKDLIAAANKVSFPSCELTIEGKNVPIAEFFKSVVGKCGDAPATAANTTAPAKADGSAATAGSKAVEPTITTPVATAPAGSKMEETPAVGSSSGSAKADKDDVMAPTTAPAKTTAAPAKSAGVAATVGAAVAVACSFAALAL